MVLSMLCWGSWANTEKIDKTWRFELYYWDYMWGILVCALLFGLTAGRTNPMDPASFFHNLDSASTRSLAEAFAGGIIFNLGNLLLVAAISVAGMAVERLVVRPLYSRPLDAILATWGLGIIIGIVSPSQWVVVIKRCKDRSLVPGRLAISSNRGAGSYSG